MRDIVSPSSYSSPVFCVIGLLLFHFFVHLFSCTGMMGGYVGTLDDQISKSRQEVVMREVKEGLVEKI